MTPEQIKVVAQQHLQSLVHRYAHINPKNNRDLSDPNNMEKVAHMMYMCEEICNFVDQNKMEKVHRWLGFLQGAMWGLNFATINVMRDQNR